MKTGKAAGLSEVNVEIIATSSQVGEEVIRKLCERLTNGKGIPNNWKTSVVVPTYKEKEMSCTAVQE